MRKSRFLSRVFVSLLVAALAATAAEAAARPEGTCAPPGAWTTGADFPGTDVRSWGAFFPPDGRFYLMGGRADDTAGDDFSTVNIYDPATDTWSQSTATFEDNQVNNMVGGVLDFGGTQFIVVVGGSAAGATTASSDTRQYDPVADTLTVLDQDPWPGNVDGAMLPGGAAVVDNKLFVFGGFDISIGMLDTIYQFDPSAAAGSRWTTMTATLPTPIGYIPTSTSNGLIYLLGGSTWDPVGATILDSAESSVYSPTTDAVQPITPIPRATAETRAVTVLDGTIWVLGGGRDAPNPSNEVDVYDPVADTWTIGPAFVNARRNIAADVDPATGNVYAIGGYDSTGAPSAFDEIFAACAPITDRIFADGFDGP
ncbi:MAG TPA: hypothetical protein VGO25_04910 [Rhodanobacteraceae bacterium]|jgi:N-acetylneuraminic acid mutarotase|nr:hypothetical protein [Rhodanobacteraceae bacterium]